MKKIAHKIMNTRWGRAFFLWPDKNIKKIYVISTGYALLGVFVAYYGMTAGSRVPAFSDLDDVRGSLESCALGERSVSLSLIGLGDVFVISGKGLDERRLYNALQCQGSVELKIRHDPVEPWFRARLRDDASSPKKYKVFQITQGGKIMLSYSEIREAHRRDDELGLILGGIFLLVAIWLTAVAIMTKQYESERRPPGS